MNFKEYKQHVEQWSLNCDSRFKVKTNLSSKIAVNFLNSRGFYLGTFIEFDKEAKGMSDVRFGNFNELFGPLTIDATNANPLLQILVVTCEFLNTPYEKRFKKAELSSKPVNNDEINEASDPDDQKYFLKNRKNGGYLKMAHGDVATAFATFKQDKTKLPPFYIVPREEASAFDKHDLQVLYSFWLQENTLSKFNEFELVRAKPEKYVVHVPLPFPATDYRGCFTMDEINEMKKDPNIAIDWNKAVIEKEKDWKHPEVDGETTVFGEE